MLREKNIFLIEDNDNDINLILNLLKEINLFDNVTIFKDGQEVLNYFYSDVKRTDFFLPTVLLLDIKLPKINGLQVLDKLKKDEKYKFIPVVMLTSSNHEKDILSCYMSGANGFVVKPVDYHEFSIVLKATINYWVNTNEPPVLIRKF